MSAVCRVRIQASGRSYLICFLYFIFLGQAQADGPHIALHATGRIYTITLFSAPEPLATGQGELTLLVQSASSGELVSGVSAEGQLKLQGRLPMQFILTRGGATNRQLPGTTVSLPVAGIYALTLHVTSPGVATETFHGRLEVEANRGKRNTVLWAVFMPGILIVLFLINQKAKQRMRSFPALRRETL